MDNTEWLKTRTQRLNEYIEDAKQIFSPEKTPDMKVDGDACTMTFEYRHAWPNKMAKVVVWFADVEFPFNSTIDVYTTIDGHVGVCNRDVVRTSTGDVLYDLLMQTKEDMMEIEKGRKGRVSMMMLKCVRKIRFDELVEHSECKTVKEAFEEAARELNELKIPEIEIWLGGFPEEVRMDVLRYAVDKRYRLEDEGWNEFNEWMEQREEWARPKREWMRERL